MAGYDRHSMSNNARAAYDVGQRPMSKWTKAAFLEECEADGIYIKSIKGSYKEFLVYVGWHHTSKFYNETAFYEVDLELVEDAIEDGVITLYTEEELNEQARKAELAAQEEERQRAIALKKAADEEEKVKVELRTCKIERRVSKNKNVVLTLVVTKEQPALLKIAKGYCGKHVCNEFKEYLGLSEILEVRVDESGE